MQVRLSYDTHGTPGVTAAGVTELYYGLGLLHARHRPLQTLVVAAAGRGELARQLIGRDELVALDALVHRLDVPGRAQREVSRLPARARERVDAYCAGVAAGLARFGQPFELRLLGARLAPPDRASVLGSLLVSAYLGLAQGQERMERALVDAVRAGLSPGTLQRLFAPHLATWEPERLRALRRPEAAFGAVGHGLLATGGSNAWAVDGTRSRSGAPLLAGDPHLHIGQLPALFLEVRARFGPQQWLGASIPGLPGLAVGRNRGLAWAGTFAVADNVDFWIEELRGGCDGDGVPVATREVEVRRRFRAPVRLRFCETSRGVLEGDAADGAQLASRWAGAEDVAEALDAYLQLPLAESVDEAEGILARAHTMSLHFVLADRAGGVGYVQAGRIPRRTAGWSGLAPAPAGGGWSGVLTGEALPRARGSLVASANEARLAPDGTVLATLAQPRYRLERIEQVLAERVDHDVESMQGLQLDLVSRQAERLRPALLAALPEGPLRRALAAWDGRYDAGSRGAHAFELARDAALAQLGGAWLDDMRARTELGTWWCEALDRRITSTPLAAALAGLTRVEPAPWGEVHTATLRHLIAGGLPGWCGFDRGPFALPGNIATVRQGNVVPGQSGATVTAPAYRFTCDLGDEAAWTALPGGIDGSRFSASYDRWLDDYWQGRYHRIAAPEPEEAEHPT